MTNRPIEMHDEVPIFPLPNVVFFPKTFLPLHIFEPRYRQMLQDAQCKERLMGMALLREGWEGDYFGNPIVHDVVCIGRIQHAEKLRDGKYNIVLYGLRRARIIEFVQTVPYRIAKVQYLQDKKFVREGFSESQERVGFLKLVQRYLIEIGVENLDELVKLRDHSLESTINQIASILDFGILEKQKLLEINGLDARYQQLRTMLNDKVVTTRIAKNVKYVPKDISWN